MAYELPVSELLTVCSSAAEKAHQLGRPVAAQWCQPVAPHDSVMLMQAISKKYERSFFWQSLADNKWMVAAGVVVDLPGHGPSRFIEDSQLCQEWLDESVEGGPACKGSGPSLVGGFAFEPHTDQPDEVMPDAAFWLPSVCFEGMGETTHLRLVTVVAPDDDAAAVSGRLVDIAASLPAAIPPSVTPSPATILRLEEVPPGPQWCSVAAQAITDIQAGALDKVVLARTLEVTTSEEINATAVLSDLISRHTHGVVFAEKSDDVWFLGATPEYLVRLHDERVDVPALAGSAPRGATDQEDDLLERSLLADNKSRREQGLVVKEVHDILAEVCETVYDDEQPHVLKLPNIQHLYSEVHAQFPESGAQLLGLIGRLHPTPAMGGYPQAAALEWLRDNETIDRGWYSGCVGWLDATDGEFAVAIRSGMIRGKSATLYAGAGLLAESDPASEFGETATKFTTMLTALGGSSTGLGRAWGPPPVQGESFTQNRR